MAREQGSERLGYQPALDGLRAISVVAVLLYHAGFSWMGGGFLGVEVFFVISGFLITTLLMHECDDTGTVSLRRFWVRRAKRLFPLLIVVVMAAASWVVVFGSAEERSTMRRDLPWSMLYANNWGQIVGDTPYFGAETSMLRHLWSLSIEEQWYLVWPVVVALAVRCAGPRWRRIGLVVLATAASAMLLMSIVARGGGALLGGPIGVLRGVDRQNFLYLSTPTRSSGLLLGAAGAMLWQPWRGRSQRSESARLLSVAGWGSLAALGAAFAWADITGNSTYLWLLPVVSIASLVVVGAAVGTTTGALRRMLSHRWLVAVGVRSYGLYLWSWPISVVTGATEGSVVRFVVAMSITVVITDISFRLVETPLRTMRWEPALIRRAAVWPAALSAVIIVGGLATFYVRVERFDRFAGDDIAEFDPTSVAVERSVLAMPTSNPSLGAPTSVSSPAPTTSTSVAVSTDRAATSAPATTTTTLAPPASSARIAIVGDSTANALAVNAPNGIEQIFPEIVNGSIDGCTVFDSGRVLTDAAFRNDFERCSGWQATWERSAANVDVVLVVIGAWDVFDIQVGDRVYEFASNDGDAYFTERLTSGIDPMVALGTRVALIEIPCMRPVESSGSRLPPLPERGEDWRVAHANDLLRSVADAAGPTVDFVAGPAAWCDDPVVATDTRLRWDGVHVYGAGANLVFETVAADILRLAGQPTPD